MKTVGKASETRQGGKGSTSSMLARMGGRMISFYSDDLTDMLLDDFLLDTAAELQKIERLC